MTVITPIGLSIINLNFKTSKIEPQNSLCKITINNEYYNYYINTAYAIYQFKIKRNIFPKIC